MCTYSNFNFILLFFVETNGTSHAQPSSSSGISQQQPMRKMPKLKPCPALLNATPDQLHTINSNVTISNRSSRPTLKAIPRTQSELNKPQKKNPGLIPLSAFKNQIRGSSSSSTSNVDQPVGNKTSQPHRITLSQLGLKSKNQAIARLQQQNSVWQQSQQQQLLQQQQLPFPLSMLGAEEDDGTIWSPKSARAALVPRCTICRRTFATHQVLLRHMEQHTDQEEYTCEACGKVCSGAFSYQKHMRIHQRSNVHRCRICYKTFTSLESLKFHALTHTGEFKCRACRRGFPNMDELESHEATHKRYECRWCDKYFMNSGNLKVCVFFKLMVKILR